MINYEREGDTLSLTPGANVAVGAGYLFGTTLFAVATSAVTSGVSGEFLTEGVVTIAKTSALAITAGDLLYWDATNSVVNKTTASQRAVGVAVADAANPSATVKMKLFGGLTLPGT